MLSQTASICLLDTTYMINPFLYILQFEEVETSYRKNMLQTYDAFVIAWCQSLKCFIVSCKTILFRCRLTTDNCIWTRVRLHQPRQAHPVIKRIGGDENKQQHNTKSSYSVASCVLQARMVRAGCQSIGDGGYEL